LDPTDLLQTAGRTTLVYFFILFVIRLLGKREVGSISAFDFIVALMLGEVVDEISYGDVTLAKGFVVIAVIAAWHLANSWGSYKWRFLDRLTGAKPTPLVEHGQIKREALARERMNEEELWSTLRLQGIDDLKEVKKATLEPNGQVSVLKEDWAEPLQKSDLSTQGSAR
jgi:uncharacterized membrane protein YcaP (DUF421 family)